MTRTPTRALWQFYKELIPFILAFTIVGKIIFGNGGAMVTFLIFGVFIGFLAFHLIKKQQFYFYNNLGLTKWKLFKIAFLINLIVGTPIVVFVLFLITLVVGDFSII